MPADRCEVRLRSHVQILAGAISLSDHRSYWAFGYRALMVTNTAMFRNPNYHQRSDLPDTLDYRRMGKITTMLARAIRRTCA